MLAPIRWTFRILRYALVAIGVGALVAGALVAVPLRQPPELASITAGVRLVDRSDIPPVQHFQARDGTELAYRLYEPAAARDDKTVVLVHGSSGSSMNMHALGNAIAGAGIRAIALDLRGHGRSGTRGDIAYIGQLEDDLADAIASFRRSWPNTRFTLLGHSSGGGFALRIAGGPLGDKFDLYVLLAPYLGPFAATSRQNSGGAHWAEPDLPRIVALSLLRRMGISCCEALPVLAFALPPSAVSNGTLRYSYRLYANFAPTGLDYRNDLPGVRRPIVVIAGEADELMDAAHYGEAMRIAGRDTKIVTIPGVDHMGVLALRAATDAVVAAVIRSDSE